jgi:hypothetical protein
VEIVFWRRHGGEANAPKTYSEVDREWRYLWHALGEFAFEDQPSLADSLKGAISIFNFLYLLFSVILHFLE